MIKHAVVSTKEESQRICSSVAMEKINWPLDNKLLLTV